jgi:hypothetical protein
MVVKMKQCAVIQSGCQSWGTVIWGCTSWIPGGTIRWHGIWVVQQQSCVGLRKYGFYDTIERIKGKNGVNSKVVHTGPLTKEVKMHPIVSPTVFILSYPCITTLCCVTEIVYAVNKGLVKLLNPFLIIFFLLGDSLLMQPIFGPNLYHDSHSLLSSHKLLQKRRANSKCITACSCFALYNFFMLALDRLSNFFFTKCITTTGSTDGYYP